MIRAFLVGVLIVALQVPALAGGGLFRRSVCSTGHCAPIVKHKAAAVIVDDYVAPVYAPAAPIIIQNNYPAPAIGSTIYGYGDQLAYNPFQIDPAEILRETARLTETSQKLTQEGLAVYQQLGTDALEYAALNDQLRARAELINATKVERIERTTQQSSVSVNQSITLIPDGKGGYSIKLGQHSGDQDEPNQQAGGLDVLKSRCASCHRGSTSKGGFELFGEDDDLAELSTFAKQKIVSLAQSGAMPPSQDAAGNELPVLTDNELAQVRVFLGL